MTKQQIKAIHWMFLAAIEQFVENGPGYSETDFKSDMSDLECVATLLESNGINVGSERRDMEDVLESHKD